MCKVKLFGILCADGLQRGRKRDRSGLAKDGEVYDDATGKKSLSKDKKTSKESKTKKEKDGKDKKEPKDKENALNRKVLAATQIMQPLGGRVTIDAKGRMVLHPNQHGNSKTDSSGSCDILLNEKLLRMKQSMWPTFMDDLNTREKYYAPRNMSEYMEDLELREDADPPSRYRVRGRIGRGGRIVMDRIPIYERHHNPATWRSQPQLAASRSSAHSLSNHYNYIYPTTLHPTRQQEHVKLFASHFKNEEFYGAGLPHVLLSSLSEDITSIFSTMQDSIDAKVPADSLRQEETSTTGSPFEISGDKSTISHNARSSNDHLDVASEVSSSAPTTTDSTTTGNSTNTLELDTSLPLSNEVKNVGNHSGSPVSAITSFQEVYSTEYQSAHKYSDDLTMFSLLVPPERDALYGLPSHREHDLFRLSDQHPKVLAAEPSLPFVMQANQLIPREEEEAESIVNIRHRFKNADVINNDKTTDLNADLSTKKGEQQLNIQPVERLYSSSSDNKTKTRLTPVADTETECTVGM